jgi:hypothetical protein
MTIVRMSSRILQVEGCTDPLRGRKPIEHAAVGAHRTTRRGGLEGLLSEESHLSRQIIARLGCV